MLFTVLPLFISQAIQEHPALENDKDALLKIYAEARQKKVKLDSVWSKFTDDLGKVRTPMGMYWNPPRATLFTGRCWAACRAAQDLKEYNDPSEFQALLPNQSAGKSPAAVLTIIADLWAWPGISDWDGSINRAASESEVNRVKFVLLTDDTPPKVIRPTVVINGEQQEFTGQYGIPKQETVTTNSSTTVSGSTGNVNVNSWSTATFQTFQVEDYRAYNAEYTLRFKILDEKGDPLVKNTHKKLTFKVIRPSGEWTVKWNLGSLVKI